MNRLCHAHRALLLPLALSFALTCSGLCRSAQAEASVAGPQPRSLGFAPDAQLAGGGGFALRKPLRNYFLARARLGMLYAAASWSLNAGATLEVGALARMGVGGEVELNVGRGFFGSVGLAHVQGDQLMGHAALGWLVFAVEWQHRFERALPHDALVFQVRVPIGLWWLQQRQPSTRPAASGSAPSRRAQAARVVSPARAAEPSEEAPAAAPVPPAEVRRAREAERDASLQDSLVTAAHAHAAGDYAGEAVALARAYSLSPDAGVALQLAAADEAQGKWVIALADLRRALAAGSLSAEQRAQVEERQRTLQGKLPHLRLILHGGEGRERVSLDGSVEPSAGLGYDVPIDPGAHVLLVSRDEQNLIEQSFQAREADLVRIELDLGAPTGR